jgi:peroxiredoxin (alkyl hydroperoxide reductase subunit C)
MTQVTATGFVVGDVAAQVGDKAPPFSVPCIRGGDTAEQPLGLTDFRGKWIILLFYPHDFSPISQSELLAFEAVYEQLGARNTELIAISTDSLFAHRAWVALTPQQGGLGPVSFALASDSTQAVAQAYGALVDEKGHAQPATFIVDPKGVLRYSVTHDLAVGRSIRETLRVLGALATGAACLADWEPVQPPA